MRSLVVSSRFPWPPITGDRLRVLTWLHSLAPLGETWLVSPPGRLPDGAAFEHAPATRSAVAAVRALGRTAGGLPVTALLAAPFDWRAALRRAAGRGGPFDLAVVVLARLHPWVFDLLPARRRLLDGVDSLAFNLAERAAAARGAARVLWRIESRRTARLEAAAGPGYTRVVAVTQEEAARFTGRVVVLSHGVEVLPLAPLPRGVDVAFWGRLAYFANRDAVGWLLKGIWPRIRSERADATLLLAGADAPTALRAAAGAGGVRVESPMADRPALLRGVRVALFPVRWGSGQPNKALEAAEAGCAIVSTPAGIRGVGDLASAAVVAEDERGLADATLRLLDRPEEAERRGAEARRLVQALFDRADARRRFARIAREAASDA